MAAAPEKAVSALRAQMATLAEKNGYPAGIALAMVALYLEISTPGFGVPGMIAIICFGTIFAGSALSTLGSLELILFLLGAVLLVVEIFLIPGFGAVGISGILLMVLALVFSQQPFAWPRSAWQWDIFLRNLRNIGLGFVGSLVTAFVLLRLFPALSPLRRLILGSSEQAPSGAADGAAGI
jgi:membrane-bound serine protease (ClpP class)